MIYPNEVTYIPRKGGQKKIFAPQTTIIENKKEDNTKAPINFPRIAIAEKINETTKVPDKVVPEIETIIKKSVTPPINQGVKKDNIKVQNKKINISTESVDNIIKKVRRNGIMKKAIQFGIVGLGQGGCRIAGEFEKLGYKTLAINTSEQDLGETPCKEKLLIGTGGAGRNLKTGAEAVNTHRAEIMTAYQTTFPNIQHALVCSGSSGGTGGGGLTSIIDTLKDYKIPVGVITTLPLNTEDTRSKKNTLSVLNELVKLNAEKKISPLIIIDNDKIEKKHPGLSTLEFWNMANEEVVKCFDVFNMLAFRTSAYTSFDPADYKRVLVSGGCMIFGTFTVTNEIQVDTLANAIASNINSGLLAEGFNLVEATTAACLIVGNPEKLQKLPRVAEENAFAMLMKLLGSGTIFKGVYPLQATPDFELFFMISGLGLPTSRVKSLIEHTKVEKEHLEKKATLRTVDDIMKELQTETETNGNGS